jgi:transcriptional regulator with PAS, ATPase and Fis domain
MGSTEEIRPEDLPFTVKPSVTTGQELVGHSLKEALDAFKRNFLQQSLDLQGGSVKETAKTLKVQRT